MSNLVNALSELGYTQGSLLLLDTESSSNIEYLDLIKSKQLSPDAVIESNGSPLLYLVYNNSFTSGSDIEDQISDLLARLACRGDHAWLAVVYFGKIEAYPIGFTQNIPPARVVDGLEDNQSFIRELESGLIDSVTKANRQYLHELLFDLLNDAAQELLQTQYFQSKLSVNRYDDVISLVGRVLFARYLADRELFNAVNVDSNNCFKNKTNAVRTCKWLDKTFNGDLLPLWDKKYSEEFSQISNESPEIYTTLTSIMLKSRRRQLSFDWAHLDFKHIPIGLLSEVYEQFSHAYFSEDAKAESIHYTPRNIASILVKQSFDSFKLKDDKIKVLDPSCGAGVFLVLCFKELVKRHWALHSKRPDTKVIRKILNEQLVGLDINSHALKLSALSLYLTAIELDPHPYPVEKLKFDNLAGNTLLNVRKKGEEYPHSEPILGSLGDGAPDTLIGKFDLVIGNPPWTAWKEGKEKKISKIINKEVTAFLKQRLNEETGYDNPDSVPDLPFIFKAGKWTRPGGIIAYAIHSRILFSLKDTAINARNSIFRAFKVTGILNCSALRNTKVWPGVAAPFALFFAKNISPKDSDGFYFISPYLESNLNSKGKVRIDYNDSKVVSYLDVVKYPYILKSLYKGNIGDFLIIKKIKSISSETVSQFWKKNGLVTSTGYSRGTKPTEKSERMNGMPNLEPKNAPSHQLDVSTLPKFTARVLTRRRDMESYKAPLILVRESISKDRSEGRSLVATEDLVYSSSFYGYSAHGINNGEFLIRLLHCLSYSELSLYYYLMTSNQFAVEREKIQKYDFESLPIIEFSKLGKREKNKVHKLSESIGSDNYSWQELDEFIYHLYGIDDDQKVIIRDTLETQLPFSLNENRAQDPIKCSDMKVFIKTLREELTPYFKITNERLIIEELETNIKNWKFVTIKNHNNKVINKAAILKVLSHQIAEENGVSMIQIPDVQSKSYTIGFINSYRYWTTSRAKNLTDYLLSAFDDVFPVD